MRRNFSNAPNRAMMLSQAPKMIVVDEKYGELLGASMIGPEVTELLPELTLARMMELTPARDCPQHPCPPDAFRGNYGSGSRGDWSGDTYLKKQNSEARNASE